MPTIVTSVPRAAFVEATRQVKDVVSIPVVASNRINDPDVAEEILKSGQADAVSMARQLLADPEFVKKTEQGKADEINTCIACNQACLDHTFQLKRASCLVNPEPVTKPSCSTCALPSRRRWRWWVPARRGCPVPRWRQSGAMT